MLEKIIESCQYVSDHSHFVTINLQQLNQFAHSIENVQMKHWLSGSPYQLLELPIETIINFLLIFEAIDFSFWGDPKWTIDTQEGKEDGSMALMYVLLRYVKEHKTTDFSSMTKNEFLTLLQGNIQIPLWESRYEMIQNVSQIVNQEMNGDFYQCIQNLTTDIALLNFIIQHFPNFKDERLYQGKTVYLYKLAQLLTSDILHIREMKEKIKVDYSHLAGCADYKIPQVMRALGILEYNQELANRIDAKQVIQENSSEEVEIRANMITAIHRINKIIGGHMKAIDINDYIWNQARNKTIQLKPYHLTRSTNY